MGKINILPSKVYNRIAAGEVVDRPASVVKELVENAIDAGATEIEIRIEQGGKQLIQVIDNGSGIERDDMPSVFLPHATSKIAAAEDLENITTLGFRGEAIASISAVSRMVITSKTKEGKCYRLRCDGGELGQIFETMGADGTDVRVESLFYHTPVRLGFLKSDKVEETEITNLVSRFILGRSDISFIYYVDDKMVLQSFGEGDEAAVASVYGASTLAQCYCIQAEKHGMRIRGYIGNQNFFKANKSYQTVFLNGRYITNATISGALTHAYASYVMKRQYPFYVLHIDMPTELVDVNVHPNKADVRFADNQIVYGSVYNVIRAVLDGQPKGLEYVVNMPINPAYEQPLVEEKPKVAEETKTKTKEVPLNLLASSGVAMVKEEQQPAFTYEQAVKEIEENAPAFTAKKRGLELPFEEVQEKKKEIRPLKEPFPKGFIPRSQIRSGAYYKDDVVASDSDELHGASKLREQFPDLYYKPPVLTLETEKEPVAGEDVFAANKKFLMEQEEKKKQDKIDVSSWQYVGKLFNTYLMYQMRDSVYVIDQHAAHERLIFNSLKAQMEARVVFRQPMIIPFSMRLNAFEMQFIRDQLPIIREMGFVIEEVSNEKFEVTEVPLDLQNIDLYSFFNDILGDVSGYRAIKLENLLRDKLASAACKAAVKGGMDLTRAEIDKLFELIDGDMGLKCPHGRPVVVTMTKKQLEKMFKRIV